MTKSYDPDRIARELLSVSPDAKQSFAFPEKRDGIEIFCFWTRRLVTTKEMVAICRDMAAVIRRSIPERPDGWAAAIYPGNRPMKPMGVYLIGWAGRHDEWQLSEGQERKETDHADWLAFRNSLRAAVAVLGVEGKEAGDGGDFKVSDDESSPLEQTLFVNKPEFLTKELIATIQNVIRDGHPDGVVNIFPSFGKPFRTLWEGLDVRAESVEEKWDRQEAELLLGDRLKIPRYATGAADGPEDDR